MNGNEAIEMIGVKGKEMVNMEENLENPNAKDKKTNTYEGIVETLGLGQIIICIILAISKLAIGWHQLGIIFLAPNVNSTCEFTLDGGTCPRDCFKYKYDSPVFNNSIVMEWDLVCDREWLKDFTQTVFMFGTLVGNIAFGILSDRFGRRKPLLVAVVMQTTTGVIAAYSWDWYSFTILRFLLALSNGGIMLITFVIVVEIIGVKYRQMFGVLFQIPFILGHGTLAGIAYLTKNSWKDLQLWISIPTVALFVYYWMVPESPRWLIAKRRYKEAAEILIKKFNTDETDVQTLSEKLKNTSDSLIDASEEKENISHLFRTPRLRRNTIFLCISWLSCGVCFFGVSQYVSHLSGDIFINVVISAVIQFPGTCGALFLNQYLGRKKTLIIALLISGVFLLVISALPSSYESVKVYFSFVGIFGMSMAFPTVYIYAGEIFPTVLRNSGMGICTMISRVGAMIAPMIAGLEVHIYWIPPFIFGILPVIAATVTLFLPETQDKVLPDSIRQSEENKNSKYVRTPQEG